MGNDARSLLHKSKQLGLVLALICSAGIFPVVSLALGLGDIHAEFVLNQPLRAQIELYSVQDKELEEMRVELAPPDVFDRVNVPRPYFLTQLKFEPTRLPNGNTVIHVTSKDPVKEPFLTFLVEISWPKGKLLREYTVLLDPPTFAKQPAAVDEAESEVAEATTPPATETQATEETSREDSYRTQKGDTLSQIARSITDSQASLNQAMIAIQQANPNVFIKQNINLLKTGVILRLPSNEEIAAVTRAQDNEEVTRQSQAWKEYANRVADSVPSSTVPSGEEEVVEDGESATPDKEQAAAPTQTELKKEAEQSLDKKDKAKPAGDKAQLEILAADKEKKSQAGSPTQAAGGEEVEKLNNDLSLAKELVESKGKENEELKSRVQALEAMLDKQEKIITLQKQQLLDMQKSLTDSQAKPATDEKKPEAVPPGATPPATETKPSESSVPKTEVPPPAQQEVHKPYVAPLPNFDKLPPIEEVAKTEETPKTEEIAKAKVEPLPDFEALEKVEQPPPTANTGQQPPVTPSATTPPPTPPKPIASTPPAQPTPPAVQEVSIVDRVMGIVSSVAGIFQSKLGAIIGGAGLVLLGALYFVRRGRQRRLETFSKGLGEPLEEDTYDDILDETIVTPSSPKVQVKTKEPEIEDTFEIIPKPATPQTPKAASSATADDDVMEEADVYISYGLHQQAEDLLKDVIAKHPNRNDYNLKLAETYFSAKNADAFEKYVSSIKGSLGEKSSEWQKIAAMGKQLLPSSATALFAGVAAASATDMLPKKPRTTDFDIGLKTEALPTITEDEFEDTVVSNDQTEEIAAPFGTDKARDSGLDFDIEDLPQAVEEEEVDDPVASRIMEANQTSDILNFEVDDLDNTMLEKGLPAGHFNLDREGTSLEALTEELSHIGASTGAEDMGLADAEEDMPTAETALADFNEDLDEVPTQIGEFSNPLEDRVDPEASTVAYPPSQITKQADTEQFDMNSLDTEFLDADGEDILQTATDIEELGPPWLIEEVGTKLDLAKAFVDMGDEDAARETLIEVMKEGDQSQIKEAKDLMNKIGDK